MESPLSKVLERYDSQATLENAWTIPAPWYVDDRVTDLERKTVFSKSWQMVARADQVAGAGQFVTAELAGEPVIVVRGEDRVLRAFFNVCRHHAAAVEPRPAGQTHLLRCPYHGWTYSLAGELKGTPEFGGVCGFERSASGLMPVEVAEWEKFVFVRLEKGGPSLIESLGDLVAQFQPLDLSRFHFFERREWTFECNWKVFVDNYLDGGYHVPHMHKGLSSVLDYSQYRIETGPNWCLQHSKMTQEGAAPDVGAVRQGDKAYYYWIYPNFMINWYEGVMDTNLVLPLSTGKSRVIFDFYFTDVSTPDAIARNRASIDVGNKVQDEDLAICDSVQKGLTSRAYVAGRLSVRREAGEHLFHRLLARDLKAGLGGSDRR
ncbi:MAG TPA: aromatic ring-hydroxylating dioxygenase subunit alpha [Thermoanaerobaculia bacterium]|nr:aromatic ring-hydroxylating dioxygenase subunit alpha [Thermoanaerobaculia bacterium]